MNSMTNGATITVLRTGKSYHTLRDWGLAIGNNNCIGEPEQETFYLDVPGADGFLDYSEALTGRPVFKKRGIEISLGGKMARSRWQSFVSTLRILLHGKQVRVVFDDFPGYYWEGRAEVTDFNRVREIGTFKLRIPQADPYGYSLNDNSTADWLWDPFDFELGVIDDPIHIMLTAASPTAVCTITHSAVPFVVSVAVSEIGETGLKMTVDGDDYLLQEGENRLAELLVSDNDLTLNFSGRGSLQVNFRRRVI